MTQIPGLYITASPIAGRGVFTAAAIAGGSLIEIAPAIVIPEAQVAILHRTVLHDYYFRWGETMNAAALLLGNGSLYNHSFTPNVRIELDFGERTVDFYALRTIEAGEELTYNYNGDPEDRTELWFHDGAER